MLSEARSYLADDPHLVLIPAAAILITSLVFNLLGDALPGFFAWMLTMYRTVCLCSKD